MNYQTDPDSAHRPFISADLLPLGIGFCALYVPTVVHFADTLWQTDEQGHGPLILAAALWMFYEAAQQLRRPAAPRRSVVSGALSVMLGLLAYIVGHSQNIAILEVASMIPTIAGALAATSGWSTVNTLRFPLFFLMFMAPVPGFIIDAMTGPLKLFISTQAESIMYALGYPVARVGVSLSVGQYQLLVADACSGLNSMVSLIAVGLFFMYLVKRQRLIHNALLLVAIPFIAVAANLVRVVAICLVTYYFGDEVGQGFVHGATGVLLFVVSLTLMFVVDAVLAKALPSKKVSA
ncbi:exosortase B [Aquabacterium sp.]|uniref:exosortase B n=1 Tax=Aquabacterium sp. TaxID=1872578 RepID=UPI0035B09C29